MISPCVQYRRRSINRTGARSRRLTFTGSAGTTFDACGGAGETNPSPDDVLDILVYYW